MKRVTTLDAEANSLWEELAPLTKELNRMGKERRRLTELLPWWAAPGRSTIDSEGNLSGDIVWYPAIQDFRLPSPGYTRNIRPSEYTIERFCDNPLLTSRQNSARLHKAVEAYKDRIVAQKEAKRDVGLMTFERKLSRKAIHRYRIRDRLWQLANVGSLAAMAAVTFWEFANDFHRRDYEGHYSMRDWSGTSIGILKLARTHAQGLLRKHVDLFLNHPNKERRTFMALDLTPDAHRGFVLIDRERIPAAVVPLVRSQAA